MPALKAAGLHIGIRFHRDEVEGGGVVRAGVEIEVRTGERNHVRQRRVLHVVLVRVVVHVAPEELVFVVHLVVLLW